MKKSQARRNILSTHMAKANHSTQHNHHRNISGRHWNSVLTPEFKSNWMSFYKKLSSKGKLNFARANRWSLQCKTNCSTWCSMILNSMQWTTSWGIRFVILTRWSFLCKWCKQKKACHFNVGSFLDHLLFYEVMKFLFLSFFKVLIFAGGSL